MRTRTFCLTESQSNELQAAYLHCQDANAKIRYQAVRLYGLGYSVAQIQDICGSSRSRLLAWVQAYRERGVPALLDHRQGGNRAKLTPAQIEALQNQLHRYTPSQLLGKAACVGDGQFWTVADAAALLERDYQVRFQSQTSYRTLLETCGFSYQRPAKQYKSHNDLKVLDFEQALEKNS
jgi:transposase